MASAPLKPLWPGDFSYKEHQEIGIDWMIKRELATTPCRGGLLCDEMGLGKTIEMIGLMKNRPAATTLLVAPVAVLGQWKVLLRRSGFLVQVPGKEARGWAFDGKIQMNPAGVVCVIGYEAATRHPSLLEMKPWTRTVFDEAHRLAGETKATELVSKIKAAHTWLLSATPIVNKLKDLKVLMELAGVDDIPPYNTLEAMKPFCETYVLARTMDQLRSSIPDAPPKPVIHTRILEFIDEEESEFYRGMAGGIVKRWKSLAGDHGRDAAIERLKLFLLLRQLSLHPQIYIEARKKALGGTYARPDFLGDSTKFAVLRRLVTTEPGGRWIIFCHFITEMEMLKNLFKKMPSVGRVQLYNGSLSAAQKESVIEETKKPLPAGAGASEVLLVQLQSGGTGLNLQHFNRIAFTGPWWTKALMDQAIGRAVRIGQREVVHVHFLKLREEEVINIDAIMMDKADFKGKLCAYVLTHAMTQVSLKTKVPVIDLTGSDSDSNEDPVCP
jgi:SNF2 family DNA or RNA helicase